MSSFEERCRNAARLIDGHSSIMAFTGAGISTESGVSDFRSPGGVWERYRMVTYQEFIADRDARKGYWRMKSELFRELSNAKPNAAHIALAALERIGKLKCLVTQNIDGLHQDAGSSPGLVIELHGTNREAVCLSCSKRWPIGVVNSILEEVDFEPLCDECNGFIKPATVSFGQAMPEEEMVKAFRCAQESEVLIMIGSSLQVEPAASIPRFAAENGSKMIYVNRTETASDHLADILFRESAGKVMSRVLELLND
ncbi:MAG: hypothetical protein JSV21_03685 [Nitrospirota bacterium]|nr:MAG: hypothetical protein JSV21_03685 [Nitrospirota bacterium]